MKKEKIVKLLQSEKTQELFQQAYQAKLNNLGAFSYLRALIEYSNFCSRNCFYCGIRGKNQNLKRFEIPLPQIKENIRNIHRQGYASFVIQSGERTDQDFIEKIDEIVKFSKNLNENFKIVLSVGEQEPKTYQKWFDSGANRYLLRIETSNQELYEKIHPPEMSFGKRVECLYSLKKIGYQTGTGILVGFPDQTLESVAEDILFFKKIDVDMLGLGPYIPCQNTPLWEKSKNIDPQKNLELSLKVIAICRILMPTVNIVASTALQTIDSNGYLRGIRAGANVLMPNLTPESYKKNFSLFHKNS